LVKPKAKKKAQTAEYLALPAEEVKAAAKRTEKRLAAGHLIRHRSKRDERTGERAKFDDVTEMTAPHLQATGRPLAAKLKDKGPMWEERAWYTAYVQAIWDALAERGEKPIFDRPEGDPVKMNGGTFPAEPGTTKFISWDRIDLAEGQDRNNLMFKIDPDELDIAACYLPHQLRGNYPHVRLVDSPSGRQLWRQLRDDGCVPDGGKAGNRLLTEVLEGVSVGSVGEDNVHPDDLVRLIWNSWRNVKSKEEKRIKEEEAKHLREQQAAQPKPEPPKPEQHKAQETIIEPFSHGLPF
jgi:hypothetical protein